MPQCQCCLAFHKFTIIYHFLYYMPTGGESDWGFGWAYDHFIDVVNKGTAAVIIRGYTTKDITTGEDIFYNKISFFIRGSGGFGGQPKPPFTRAASVASQPIPTRKPDWVAELRTSQEQAVLYRLYGRQNGNARGTPHSVAKLASLTLPYMGLVYGYCG